jgi:hypothetical protein
VTTAQVRALERLLAERDEEIAGLRRLILDVACTPAGLALLEAGGTGGSEGESGA